MPSTTAVTLEEIQRYMELSALELLVSSGFALGGALSEHLEHVDLEDGYDIRPHDDKPGLIDSFNAIMTEKFDSSREGRLFHARGSLLLARMLRSITPEVVNEAASYFEALAAHHLEDAFTGKEN
jgi:hypothetical protein